MKISEISNRQIYINQTVDGGSLEGYVVSTDQPQLGNYLQSQGASEDTINQIRNRYNTIGILRNMYVDEESRGQGIGNDLVGNAIEAAAQNGAEAMVLVADMSESNEFDLAKWYEGFGFETIGNASGDPVMVMDLSQ